MYLDLYKGLNLKPEDLERYDLPLIGFDGRTVIPREGLSYQCKSEMRKCRLTLLWWKPIPLTRKFWQDLGFMQWEQYRLPYI